jgi:hypothetical protein
MTVGTLNRKKRDKEITRMETGRRKAVTDTAATIIFTFTTSYSTTATRMEQRITKCTRSTVQTERRPLQNTIENIQKKR